MTTSKDWMADDLEVSADKDAEKHPFTGGSSTQLNILNTMDHRAIADDYESLAVAIPAMASAFRFEANRHLDLARLTALSDLAEALGGDAEGEARDSDGKWTSGGGGGDKSDKDAKPAPTTLRGKIGAILKAGAAKAIEKIRATPGAIKAAVVKQLMTVKEAALGIKAAIQGKPLSDEQKSALKEVALKIAAKVAIGALGVALPGVGHAFGKAMEHIGPHIVESIAHHLGTHAAEHVVEHAIKSATSRAASAVGRAAGRAATTSLLAATVADIDVTDSDADWLIGRVCDGVQDALDKMSDADWDKFLSDVS